MGFDRCHIAVVEAEAAVGAAAAAAAISALPRGLDRQAHCSWPTGMLEECAGRSDADLVDGGCDHQSPWVFHPQATPPPP